MNAHPSRRKRTRIVDLTPVESTLTRFPITIATKGLTKNISPLDATLTKKRGAPVDTEMVPFES